MAESDTHSSSQPAGATNTKGSHGFERFLPENCVEYMLFFLEADVEPRRSLSSLEAVRKAAVQLTNQLTKEYIWQREDFSLEIKSTDGKSCPLFAP